MEYARGSLDYGSGLKDRGGRGSLIVVKDNKKKKKKRAYAIL